MFESKSVEDVLRTRSFYAALFALVLIVLNTVNPDVANVFNNISPYLIDLIEVLFGGFLVNAVRA